MTFAELTPNQKEELAVSLAVLACYDTETEISADNLNAALKASKNTVSSYVTSLFADCIAKGLKVDDFLAGPSASGGAAAPAGGAAASAEEKVEEKEEEEEEADMGGGMDMFGGGDDY